MFAMGRLGKLGVVARAVQGAFAQFSPASLFANGEQGLWYDVGDFDRYMSKLGPDSVVNGGFDNGLTGWTSYQGNASVVNGRAKISSPTTWYDTTLRQTQPFDGEGWYRVRADIENVSMQSFCTLQSRYVSGDSFIASSQNLAPAGSVFKADFSFYANAPFLLNLLVDVNVATAGRECFIDNIRCEKLTAINTATLFQDAAGTIPVTAVEQPVGRILDKSGRGNHASQANTLSRAWLRARYSLLTQSEDFSNPAWIKAGSPTLTNLGEGVWRLQANAGSSWLLYQNVPRLAPEICKFSIDVKSNGSGLDAFRTMLKGVDTQNFAAAEGWTRIVVTGLNDGSGSVGIIHRDNAAIDILIRFPDLRPDNLPIGLPAYQRIAAATDYDTTGFPVYLDPDGIDDNYVTGSIDFSSTDKMTVWAGLRDTSTALSVLCELSEVSNGRNGSFVVYRRSRANGDIAPGMNTGASFGYRETSSPAGFPRSTVESIVFDGTTGSVATAISMRANGTSPSMKNYGAVNTGNFRNYPLYLFSRGGTSLRFKGQFYGLIIRGAETDATQLEQTEQYLNGKMGGIY